MIAISRVGLALGLLKQEDGLMKPWQILGEENRLNLAELLALLLRG